MSSFLPGLVLALGGATMLVLPARIRPVMMVAAFGLAVLQLVVFLDLDATWEAQWLGFDLMPLRVDALSLAFGSVFAIIGLLGSVYALHMRDRHQQAAVLFLGSGSLGVVFAGDLLTLVV
ncbi:MAG: Na+/H+ antiporter subunit D, partial [Chloroflexota bacterium]|nr:Na+/H+ antiporter subunit D [Chloroflexota bacterium]